VPRCRPRRSAKQAQRQHEKKEGGSPKNIFDLNKLELNIDAEGNCAAFYEGDQFIARIIILEPGSKVQDRVMDSNVILTVIKGTVTLTRNGETAVLTEDQAFVSGPAVLTLSSDTGARLMDVRINNRA